MRAAPAELEQAAVGPVRDAHEERLGTVVRAEGHARDLPEDADLLRARVTRGDVADVHEVGGLRRGQEPPVRRELQAPDGADPPLEHRQRLRRVAHVPQPARPVLVPRRQHAPVRVPRRREGVVQMPPQGRDFLADITNNGEQTATRGRADCNVQFRICEQIVHILCIYLSGLGIGDQAVGAITEDCECLPVGAHGRVLHSQFHEMRNQQQVQRCTDS